MTIIARTDILHGPIRRALTRGAEKVGHPFGLLLSAVLAASGAALGASRPSTAAWTLAGGIAPWLVLSALAGPSAWRAWRADDSARE